MIKSIYYKIIYFSKKIEIEALIWSLGLISFSFLNPYDKSHFTLFLPSLLFDIPSPGYNLGHSIAFLYRGQIPESFSAHPLGLLIFVFLIYRIFYLLKRKYFNPIMEEI